MQRNRKIIYIFSKIQYLDSNVKISFCASNFVFIKFHNFHKLIKSRIINRNHGHLKEFTNPSHILEHAVNVQVIIALPETHSF